MRKSLLVITSEPPYPPRHGAPVDQWSRYGLLKQLGWKLAVATWATRASEAQRDALRAGLTDVFSPIFLFRHDVGPRELLQRLLFLPWHSPFVSSRRVAGAPLRALQQTMGVFRPDAVMLDSLYGGMLALTISEALRVPLIYRANNIEHIYMAGQAKAASDAWKRFRLTLASWHLENFETNMHRKARWTFDCSAQDLDFWRARGFTNNSWAPPIFDDRAWAHVRAAPWPERSYDAVYLGNLVAPNNVEGLVWLFEEVLPRITRRLSGFRLLVAGANPTAQVRALVAGHPEADLIANTPDATATRCSARVQINPVRRGSGINVKSVEMLFLDSPVVTTSVGVQGFSTDVRRHFMVADDADGFANAIVSALEGGPVDHGRRAAVRNRFSGNAPAEFAAQLAQVIENPIAAIEASAT